MARQPVLMSMLLRVSSVVLIAVVADLSTMYGYGDYGCTMVSVYDNQKPFDIQITGYVRNTAERASRYQGPTSPAHMSAEQFWAYCRYNNWSNHTILNKASWYIFPSFVAVAEQLPEYEAYLHTFYKKYRRYRRRDKIRGYWHGTYTPGLAKQLEALHERYHARKRAADERRHRQLMEQQAAEAQRAEAQRLEMQRIEIQRLEKERAEAQRVETQRAKTQRAETERIERERIETERAEMQRIELQCIEMQHIEMQRREESTPAQDTICVSDTTQQHGTQQHSIAAPRMQARAQAVAATREHPHHRIRHTFRPLSGHATAFAEQYGIATTALITTEMNPYEAQIATELIDQVRTGADLLQATAQPLPLAYHWIDLLGHTIATGIAEQQQHHIAAATYWTDVGWKIVDVTNGLVSGVCLGVTNTVHFWLNPIDGIHKMIDGIVTIVGGCAYAAGVTLQAQMPLPDDEKARALAEYNLLMRKIDAIIDHVSAVPLDQKVKHITAFATEIALPGTVIAATRKLCAAIKPYVATTIAAIQKQDAITRMAVIERAQPLIGTTAELSITTVDTATAAPSLIQGVECTVVTASQSTEIIKDASAMSTAAEPASYVPHETLQLLCKEHTIAVSKDIATIKHPKIVGVHHLKGVEIVIDFEHIFGIKLLPKGSHGYRVTGWHHDPSHTIETTNLIKFIDKVNSPQNTYRATLVINGYQTPCKSFFPASWARQDVVDAIAQAYQHADTINQIWQIKNDLYFSGLCQKGFTIEGYVNVQGIMTTAYPLIAAP